MATETRAPRRQKGSLTGSLFAGSVGEALLHLQDPMWLDDSPLVELTEVQRLSKTDAHLFADGIALRTVLIEAIDQVMKRLPNEDKPAILKATLQGVLRGQSVAAIAREHGKSREHFSRTYWRRASKLVADALQTS
jgi:DNA-binding phage protein